MVGSPLRSGGLLPALLRALIDDCHVQETAQWGISGHITRPALRLRYGPPAT